MNLRCSGCGKGVPIVAGETVAVCPYCYTENPVGTQPTRSTPPARSAQLATGPGRSSVRPTRRGFTEASTEGLGFVEERASAANRPRRQEPKAARASWEDEMATMAGATSVSQQLLITGVLAAAVIIVSAGGLIIWQMLQQQIG